MTKKVLFTEYDEFIRETDTFVMRFIELFFTTDKTSSTKNATYVLDYIDRFNELYDRQKLTLKDKELVISFFTCQGIIDTIDSAFEFKIAYILAFHINRGIENFLIQLLGCKPDDYTRADLRQSLNYILQ